MMRGVRSICCGLITLPVLALAGAFDPNHDTPGYANETVFAYDGRPTAGVEDGVKYTRRCFILVKGVLQFRKFARFEPDTPALERDEIERRIVEVCHTPPWSERPERVVFPGFADLRELSEVHGDLLREHMGIWLPTYLRFGNMRIMMPSLAAGRKACAEWLKARVEQGEPAAVLICSLPGMVHAVLAYDVRQTETGDLAFTVYDPNLLDEPRQLRFLREEAVFEYEPTFYFDGGEVNVLRIYLSPFH